MPMCLYITIYLLFFNMILLHIDYKVYIHFKNVNVSRYDYLSPFYNMVVLHIDYKEKASIITFWQLQFTLKYQTFHLEL